MIMVETTTEKKQKTTTKITSNHLQTVSHIHLPTSAE